MSNDTQRYKQMAIGWLMLTFCGGVAISMFYFWDQLPWWAIMLGSLTFMFLPDWKQDLWIRKDQGKPNDPDEA